MTARLCECGAKMEEFCQCPYGKHTRGRLLQDDSRELSRWFASKVNAKQEVRNAVETHPCNRVVIRRVSSQGLAISTLIITIPETTADHNIVIETLKAIRRDYPGAWIVHEQMVKEESKPLKLFPVPVVGKMKPVAEEKLIATSVNGTPVLCTQEGEIVRSLDKEEDNNKYAG